MKKAICRAFCIVSLIAFAVALRNISAMEQGVDGYTFARCMQSVAYFSGSCTIACAFSNGGMNR